MEAIKTAKRAERYDEPGGSHDRSLSFLVFDGDRWWRVVTRKPQREESWLKRV